MPSQDDINQLIARLQAHRQTLAHYLRQRAMLSGAYEPPGVDAGIREARREIAHIKQALRSWNVPFEDLPDDIVSQDDPIPHSPWQGALRLVLGNPVYNWLSVEAFALAFLCTAVGVVLGINMMCPWGGLGGGLLGAAIGYLIAVAYIGKTQEDRRKYAFYITRMAFSHLFEERIQVILAQRWYVAPADLDDLKYTYNLDDDHLTYPMSDYVEKHPVEVQYVYLYDKSTRQPVAYKREARSNALTPVKVLINTTQAPPDDYIVSSYPLLSQ